MTTNSMAYNRTLFIEDNLPVLRGLDTESVDLIATDPPFNKGVGAFEGTTKAGVDVEFKDVWYWGDVQEQWIAAIAKKHPSLFNVIQYTNKSAGDDMGAFMCWMAVRILEMHRLLKPTGSLYLHCDSTASHYLKAVLDTIFGRANFRSEIIWKRTPAKSNATRGLPVNDDRILCYSKSDMYTWNTDAVRVPYDMQNLDKKTASKYRHRDESGRLYRLDNLNNPAQQDASSNMTYEVMGVTRTWRWTRERMQKAIEDGIVIQTKPGRVPQMKRYLDEQKGRMLSTVWTDINPLNSQAKERTGWPTQKPLKLYKRMIEASSNPGDLVLDPFAGCATTCVAAEQLGREWIAIDIQERAEEVILDRLQREVNASMAWDSIVRILTDAPERTDDGEPVAPELIVTSRKKNAPKIPVSEARRQLIERDGMRCQGCGWVPPYADYLEVDHKRPKSRGGRDEMPNFTLLCSPCNGKKSNKLTLAELRIARADEGRMDAEWWEDKQWE